MPTRAAAVTLAVIAFLAGLVGGLAGSALSQHGRVEYSTADGKVFGGWVRVENGDLTIADGNLILQNGSVVGDLTGNVTIPNAAAVNVQTGGSFKKNGAQEGPIPDLQVEVTLGSLPTPTGSFTISNAAAPTTSELLRYCVELDEHEDDLRDELVDLGILQPSGG